VTSEGDERTIREGIEAAEHWPDFAQESADISIRSIRDLAQWLDVPPRPNGEVVNPVNSFTAAVEELTASAEQSMANVAGALIERSAEHVRWFGVPMPPDIAAVVERLDEKQD
jgi:hypothetical protein